MPKSPISLICLIEGCGKPTLARGWCSAHWTRWQRHGDPLGGSAFRRKEKVKCAVDGCDKYARYKYFCSLHFERWKSHGDPTRTVIATEGEIKQFLAQAVLHNRDECLFWPFGTSDSGYGIATFAGRSDYVHRFICAEAHGSPPSPSHQAAHSCGKGHLGCVAPLHLRWATPTENAADKQAHGTKLLGEQVPAAKLTEKEVSNIRTMYGDGGRMSMQKIADMFGIGVATTHQIIRRKNWKHVT